MKALIFTIIVPFIASKTFALDPVSIKSISCTGSRQINQIRGQRSDISSPLYLNLLMVSGYKMTTLLRRSALYKTSHSGTVTEVSGPHYDVNSSNPSSDVTSPFIDLGVNVRSGMGFVHVIGKENASENVTCEIEVF